MVHEVKNFNSEVLTDGGALMREAEREEAKQRKQEQQEREAIAQELDPCGRDEYVLARGIVGAHRTKLDQREQRFRIHRSTPFSAFTWLPSIVR